MYIRNNLNRPYLGSLLSLNLSIGDNVSIRKVLCRYLNVGMLRCLSLSVHKRRSYGPSSTPQLHVIEGHLLHPL